jgi:hypothetical protein
MNKKEVNSFLGSKKGQGIGTNAIVLIILGLIILVVLAIGFFLGWDKIAPWLRNDNNIDDLAKACQTACSTQSTFDFCTKTMEVKLDKATDENLLDLEDGQMKKCVELANISSLGISSCPGLCSN